MSLAAVIMVGVGDGSDEHIGTAIATALAAAAIVGLVNGILIGGLKLNALIVTLAVGLIVIGVVNRYGQHVPGPEPGPRRAVRLDLDPHPRVSAPSSGSVSGSPSS